MDPRNQLPPNPTAEPPAGQSGAPGSFAPATTSVPPADVPLAPQPIDTVEDVASPLLSAEPMPAPVTGPSQVNWTASEFIAHHKSTNWYMALAGIGFLITVIVFLITRDIFSTAVVIVGTVLFGVMASRQPRQMPYQVDTHGIIIGQKGYPYGDFRSFSVVDEGPFSSIVFMPLKRFQPPLSIYYPPEEENEIVEVLAQHLPMHEHQHDLTEQLMRRIRF